MQRWSILIAVFSALLVDAPSVEAQPAQKRQFYDFSATEITATRETPGVSLIFGEDIGRSFCQEDDPDSFRLCLGERRDTFRSLPRGEAAPVDIALVSVGSGSARALADAVGGLSAAHRDRWVDIQAALYPHPVTVPRPPEGASELPRSFVAKDWERAGRSLREVALSLDRAVRVPSGLSYLNVAVRSGHLDREPYRKDTRLLVAVVATEENPWGGLNELVKALNGSRGAGNWDSVVLCMNNIDCSSYRPLLDASGGKLVTVGPGELGKAVEEACRDTARQFNRWHLSDNPSVLGEMEVRINGIPVRPTAYSYDPFERRIRVSDSMLDADKGANLEVWYFPFDETHVLAKVCPDAIIKGTATERKDSESRAARRPCDGWMADELVAPEPKKVIDVAFVAPPGVPESRTGRLFQAGLRAFRAPFRAQGIDMREIFTGESANWRPNAFKVAILPPGTRYEAPPGADASLVWHGTWRADELETLAYRAVSRTVSLPVSGMPIFFDSLKVYLNGRRIEPTTRDGAGYVLRKGKLFLDVAAPLHRQSHVFAVYRHDKRRRKRR